MINSENYTNFLRRNIKSSEIPKNKKILITGI